MNPCVLFDMDGTVLDTLTTITYYVNETLRKYHLPPITQEQSRYFVGNGAKKLIERALEHDGADPALFSRAYRDYNDAYNADPAYLTSPYPGVLCMMRTLRVAGIRIGILSNKPHEAIAPLAARFFGDLVDIAWGGREDIPLKPDPRAAFALCAALDSDPAHTVYVGDSGVDMHTGRAFGAALTVGVLWGFRGREELEQSGAQALISTPQELTELILKTLA